MLAKSLFDRGLTHGSTGNISARTTDGGLLVSPTGTSFGRLDPARLSHFDASGKLIDGDPPTHQRDALALGFLRHAFDSRCSSTFARMPFGGMVNDAGRRRRQLLAAVNALRSDETWQGQTASVLPAR